MTELNLLILEDVPFDVELIERELKKADMKFTSRIVDREESYLKEIKIFKPDLILADHSLPHFDGLTALEIAKKECPNVPFIFVSGKIGEEFAVEALKSGATDYVFKGNLSKIVLAINRALEEVEEQNKRLKIEKELFKSHELLTEAQKIGKIGSWEYHLKNNIVKCSDELLNILDLNKVENDMYFDEFISFVHPEDINYVKEEIDKALKDKDSFSYEFRILGPDKNIKFLSCHAKIIRNLKGEPLRIIGTEQDITTRKISENKLRESLEEKEMLLQEIHHRVKNNLQVIYSLLRLQSRFIKDKESQEIFKETQNRIRSIAVLHEKLYRSKDLGRIGFADYVISLVKDIFHSYGTDTNLVNLNVDVGNIYLNIETAIPCGIIINELVSNSLKHAFFEGKSGSITIRTDKDEEGYITLSVSDDGVGMPSDIDFDNIETLGLQLVQYLTNRIKGEIFLNNDNGTEVKIIFKELEYINRT
ncbi:MAG: histidine kinase dimerization/phosphoacceptor domain -containing protein [Methanomicrobiales archaeon]